MKVIIAIALCFFLIATPVLAHQGRTDSNGGHTDHSTGEYHYHHGYPAHDHYDMDGDGDLDCPYNFIDNTDKESNGSSSSIKIDKDETTATKATTSTSKKDSDNSKGDPVWNFFGPILEISLLAAIVYGIYRLAKKSMDNKKE